MSDIRVVRDFIYLDVERLYSLYSQVFEGLVESIVHSYESSIARGDVQRGRPLSGSQVDSEVSELTRRTENQVLYDHMYNKLEREIDQQLLDATDGVPSDLLQRVHEVALLKVKGDAHIEDYQRMEVFIEKFNDVGEAIAHATSMSAEIAAEIDKAKQVISGIKNRNERKVAEAKLKKAWDPKELATKLGLRLDETHLKNLKMFTTLFNPEGFAITVTPGGGSGMAFRAPIDRRWLRIAPNLLRSLYGTVARAHWVLVGQVTYVPGSGTTTPDDEEFDADSKSDSEVPAMRDAFRKMFGATKAFEQMFLESHSRIEIILQPLAVYREYALPKRS